MSAKEVIGATVMLRKIALILLADPAEFSPEVLHGAALEAISLLAPMAPLNEPGRARTLLRQAQPTYHVEGRLEYGVGRGARLLCDDEDGIVVVDVEDMIMSLRPTEGFEIDNGDQVQLTLTRLAGADEGMLDGKTWDGRPVVGRPS